MLIFVCEYRQLSMNTLIFSKPNSLVQFYHDHILYFKAAGNYVEVHLYDGSKHTMTMQLEECRKIIHKQIQDNSFVRVGKSYIVYIPNVHYINLTENKIKFKSSQGGKDELSGIDRKALKEIKDYLENK